MLAAWVIRACESRSKGVCSIEEVDVQLLRATVVIEGLTLTDRAPRRSTTSLTIARVKAFWGWRQLIFESGGVDVEIDGLDLSVDVQTPWTGLLERSGQGLPLASIRSLQLRDGRVAVRLVDTPVPIVELVDVEVSLRATAFGVGNRESMSSHATLTAVDRGGGRLDLDASFAPLAPGSAWSVEVSAEAIDLRPLTPISRRLFEMDIERGAISAHAQITHTLGRRRGRIDHEFHDLQLLTPGEVETRHPMAEALFSAMLSSSDQPLRIDSTPDTGGERAPNEPLDLSSGLDDATYGDALERITAIIHRGFERRLNTLDGYAVTIDSLEVDYPHNTLSFGNIEVRKIRELGVPEGPAFFSLAKLIVNVEQSIVDREIDTYKAITLVRPHLIFVADTTAERSQLHFDPEWVDKISAMPYPTDSMTIEGGRIEYLDVTGEAPISLGVTELEVRGSGLGRRVDPSAPEPFAVELSANIVRGGTIRSKLHLRPQATPPEGRFELQLSETQLALLNPVSRRYAQIDSSKGSISLDLTATLKDGVARSVIIAKLDNVELLGAGEQHRRPLRELLVGRRLRTLDGKPIEVSVPAATLDEFREVVPTALVRAVLDASKSEPLRERR